MARSVRSPGPQAALAAPPPWIEPQLSKLVERAPGGAGWVHEVKFDGYRMAARINRGDVRLLTRSGLDWTEKYPSIVTALGRLRLTNAYLDGELCGVDTAGVSSFELMQQAAEGDGGALVYYAFDLLHLDGEPLGRGR